MKNIKRLISVFIMISACIVFTGCSSFTFKSKELTAGKVGEAYSDSVASEDKAVFYELDYDAVLPQGLTFSDDGTISGTPLESGTVTFLVIASIDDKYKEAQFTITIDKGSIKYETRSISGGKTGEPYLQNIGTAVGAEDITYVLKEGSRLPAGLALSETGEITGIPAAVETVTFTVTASAADCDTVEAEFSLMIEEGDSGPVDLGHIVFEGWTLPEAEVGTEYNESIRKAYGVPGIEYSVKYVNGVSFPKGISFNELGFIHGVAEDSTIGMMQFQIIASAEGYEPVTADCYLRVSDIYVETNTFEAEHIDVSKLQGAGYSSSPSGKGMLQKFANASGGYVLGYLHKAIAVNFFFESEQASEGKLVLGLGTEVGTITFTPKTLKIYINDVEIDYSSIEVVEDGTGQETKFKEIVLTPDISIEEGENKLTLEILNTSSNEGIGTSTAKGPMIDYVRIDGADVKLGWRPVTANTK